MINRTPFRLLGLSTVKTDDRSLRDARHACARLLCLPEAVVHDDEALASRLCGVLTQRGFTAESAALATTPADPDPNKHSILAGAVWRDDMLEDLSVEIEPVGLDGKMQGDTPLGRTKTTAHGQFILKVSRANVKLVCIHFKNRRDETLHRTRPKALRPELWIEWSESGEPAPKPGGFELREATLKAALIAEGNNESGNLDEVSDASVVASLAELTGIPEVDIRYLAVTAAVAKSLDIPSQVVAAVVGRGRKTNGRRIPFDEADVQNLLDDYTRSKACGWQETRQQRIFDHREHFLQAATWLETRIERAAEAGHISRVAPCQVKKIRAKVEGLRQIHKVKYAKRKPGKAGHTWMDLFAEAGLKGAEQIEALAEALVKDQEEDVRLLLDKEKNRGIPSSDTLLEAIAVAALAGHDRRIIKPFLGMSVRAVARLDTETLHDNLRRAIPAEGERGQLIERMIEEADTQYPGDALIRRRHPSLKKETRAFLKRRGDAFDIAASFIDEEIAREDDRDEIRDELLALQRVTRVARHGRVADQLLDSGYDSAQYIAFTDASVFTDDLAAKGIDSDNAVQIHRRARARYRAALELYLRLNRDATGPGMAVLPVPAEAALRDEDAMRIPTYAHLFGSQDYGKCEDWESVTSHSAYLVDLLVWLSRAPVERGDNHPYDELVSRRPDLVTVLLDKSNTKTLVPHIDLACELLENEVARKLEVSQIPLDDLQTTRTQEEIRAYPEHVNSGVYDSLRNSTAAMSLPFALPLEEVRRYLRLKKLNKKEITRLSLIDLFGFDIFEKDQEGIPTQPSKDVAAEVLGINRKEFDVIATVNGVPPDDIWGSDTMIEVADFLRIAASPSRPREHLSYDELIYLLDMAFINPNGDFKISLREGIEVDRCKADERIFSRAFDAPALDRIHRVLRLLRHMQCSFAELDLLIAGVGGGTIDASFLVHVAALCRCRKKLCITTEEAAALFRDFSEVDARVHVRPDGTVPLYRRVFLLRTDADEIPEAFIRDTENPPRLDEEAGRISAALAISKEDMPTLLAATGLEEGKVTFANLSILFRYALMRHAVHSVYSVAPSIADLKSLIDVLGSPFGNIKDLATFLERLLLVKKAGLTEDDLRALCMVGDSVQPESENLHRAVLALRENTAAALMQAGRPYDDDAVTAEIRATKSWQVALDTRLSSFSQWLVIKSFEELIESFIDPVQQHHQNATRRLGRVTRLIACLRVKPSEATHIHRLPGFSDLMSANGWDQLGAFIERVIFARELTMIEALANYCTKLDSLPRDPTIADCSTELAKLIGCDPAKVEAAWWALDATNPPVTLVVGDYLARVHKVMVLSEAFGVEPAALRTWASGWPDSIQATMVRDAVRSTMAAKAWLASSAEAQDALRGKKRNALVDFLSATDSDLAIPSDFMGRFLIDVDMEACRDTSRIVQAASTVQIFVQRCLLGLETDVLPNATNAKDTAHWRQWEWRKRYRVWEANRKIFLYPENYLSMSNRGNASPLFQDFQKHIAEDEITEEKVSTALEKYLYGLEKISRLSYETVDTFTTDPSSGGDTVLGAVARSGGSPPTYYYRKFFDDSWTPWEEVSFGPSPTALALAQGDGRAWVVWPTVTEHAHPEQKIPLAQANEPNDNPLTVEDDGGKGITYVRYAWTMRDDKGVWSPMKTTSRAVLMIPRSQRGLVINVNAVINSPDTINIVLYSPKPPDKPKTGPLLEAPKDAVHWTAKMQIIQDATIGKIHSGIAGFKDSPPTDEPKWKEHYSEYRLFNVVDSDPNYREKHPFLPWDNFHFNGNKMLTGASQDSILKIPMIKNWGQSVEIEEVELISMESPLSATKHRGYTRQPSTGTYVARTDAFVVSGDQIYVNDDNANQNQLHPLNWSAMFISPRMLPSLLSEALRKRLLIPENKYLMLPAYHPFASQLLAKVQAGGIRAIYSSEVQEKPSLVTIGKNPIDYGTAFGLKSEHLAVLTGGQVQSPSPEKRPLENLDFDAISPYGLYNYETFFFAPLLVAQRLNSKLQYEKAQKFLHFIFNPLSTESGDSPSRFWITKPFRKPAGLIRQVGEVTDATATTVKLDVTSAPEDGDWENLDIVVLNVRRTIADHTTADPCTITIVGTLSPEEQSAIVEKMAWLAHAEDVQSILIAAATPIADKIPANPWSPIERRPFDPHNVAAHRPIAYKKYVVRCYLDNLIDWGDQLYRRSTREAIDEATPIYQLAQTILGEAPNQIRPLEKRLDRAFETPDDWLGGSNLLAQLEALVQDVNLGGYDDELMHLPIVLDNAPSSDGKAKSLYFRVPPNGEMLQYWNTIEQRLNYIHSCLTIDGSVAKLPLAAAPIDPQALADAAVLGLSVADALAAATEDPPPYRFRQMLAKAQEYCNEAKALGASLLGALEKRDAEQLAAVRSEFEKPILKASRIIKKEQERQADQEIVVLKKFKEVIESRKKFYSSREYMNECEKEAHALSFAAGVLDAAGTTLDLASSGLQLIPDVKVGVSGFGGTPVVEVEYGGSKASSSVSKWAQGTSKLGGLADREAGMVSTQASYTRRKEEWDHQMSQAQLELKHIDEQIVAANLRKAVVVAELKGQDAQDDSWQQTERLLNEKFTKEELYDWHLKRLADLYRRCYDQALELALLARACFAFETGSEETPRPDHGAWEISRAGLTAGEALAKYLRDLDMRFLKHKLYDRLVNPQHVSLRHAAPMAFLRLLTQGATGDFNIPAWWFQRLYPGLKNRRIRSLSVSIPCITGAFANVNATLLYKGNDQTVVKSISLSTANHDFGWDMSPRSERYVPFEGIRLDKEKEVLEWHLSFPADGIDFDLASISDVLFHFEYTADEVSDPGETPDKFNFFVDLARSVPEAWSELIAIDGIHSCRFDTSALLPTFLKNYVVDAVEKSVLLPHDGEALEDRLDCIIDPEETHQIEIRPLQGADIPWSTLRDLLLVIEVSSPQQEDNGGNEEITA